MAESDPLNPKPNPADSPAEREPNAAEITDAPTLQVRAAPHATGQGARGWQPPSLEDLQQMLPQFEIRELIGRGGMGAVYRGMQRSLDREVAIKILPPEMAAQDAQFPARFKREGKAMARLNHPRIVTVFDAGETPEGLLYFVMEYVEGTDVQAMLSARGSLPVEEALPILINVCEALEFAHTSGFIHRDIKPANIMVDDRGRVKVADFGLARAMAGEASELTGRNMPICTAEFAAPETYLADVKLDGRADLYSVGVTLYHILTGQIPRGRFADPSACVPGLHPRIDAIVNRAMQTDREQRYSTARELSADLEGVLEESLAKTAGGEAPRRRNGWLVFGAAVAALLAIAAVVINVRKSPSPSPGADPLRHSAPAAGGTASAAGASSAPQDGSFVNTLGMKFVPVPIIGGPSSGQPVLFSVWETRVQDYEVFAKETGREWPPPFDQSPKHPAVNVNWDDAQAFCAWLTERERKAGRLEVTQRYRLPTDHEWSGAVGLGESEDAERSPAEKGQQLTDVFPWGSAWPPPARVGNYSGTEAAGHETWKDQSILAGYHDGFPVTSPVGSFPANRFGLFDLGGNAWEWCEDRIAPGQEARVMRGASFNNGGRGSMFSSKRDNHPPGIREGGFGFRIVVASGSPRPTATAAKPAWRPVPFKLNARLDSGFVHLVKYESWGGPNFHITNGAVRAVIAWQPNQPGRNDYIKVTARWSDDEHYYAYLTGPSVEVGLYQARKVTPLQRWAITPPPAPDEAIPLQLACVGQHLAVWVRGRLLGTWDDTTLTAAGNVGVQAADGHIQNLEYINLDEIPEAQAMTLLGLDPPAATR